MNDMGPLRRSSAAPPVPFAALLASLGEGVVVQSEDGAILYANPRARAQLGLDGELPATVELPWFGGEGLVPGLPGVPVHDVFESGTTVDARVVGLRSARGGRRWLALSATPLWSADLAEGVRPARSDAARASGESPSAAVITVRDVTAAWRDRQRLAREARFRAGLVRLLDGALGGGFEDGFDRTLLEVAIEILPNAQGGLLLRREAGELFVAAAAVGYDLDRLKATRYRPGAGAALDGGRVTVARPGQEPRLAPLDPGAAKGAAPAAAAQARLNVPLVSAGRASAVLVLENYDRLDAFGGDAVDDARILAAAMATVWQRFHLEEGARDERARVEYATLHDSLTGLPNRSLFVDRLERAMAGALRDGRGLALMFLDLDDFGRVNEELGTEWGDQLLVRVAARLQAALREADTVARWGGDQFALLLTGLRSHEDAAVVAAKALELFAAPFDVSGRPLTLRASLGIDVYPHQAVTATELLGNAEMALYRAKVEGKAAARYFTAELNDERAERERLERELRRALGGDDIVLHYQPRVDLATLRVNGVEALVRWRRGPGPLVEPGVLLAAADAAGVADDLGNVVLRQACARAAAWRHERIDVPVSVNLSAGQLSEPGLAARVGEALAAYRLPAGALEVEVSEAAALLDPAGSVRALGELRALGVPVALDDVGCAATSLTTLARLAPTRLKIDASLVTGLDGGEPATAAVRAVLALGHSLGCVVVAEAVETPAQRRALRALGCDEAQGFLFARPADAAAIERLLERGRIDPGARPDGDDT